MNTLNLFGLFAILFMLLCYCMEARSPRWTLGFAFGCLLSSAYGFLQGAWPFGAVELLWTGIALHRWRQAVARQHGEAAGAGITDRDAAQA
jgi:hypothetical protein